jgi:hypothetical protein
MFDQRTSYFVTFEREEDKMDFKFCLFVLALFVCLVNGDNLVSKQCPERPILEKFDVSKVNFHLKAKA